VTVSIRKFRIVVLISNRIEYWSNYSIRNFEYSHSTTYCSRVLDFFITLVNFSDDARYFVARGGGFFVTAKDGTRLHVDQLGKQFWFSSLISICICLRSSFLGFSATNLGFSGVLSCFRRFAVFVFSFPSLQLLLVIKLLVCCSWHL